MSPPDPAPSYRRFLVYGDETGTTGQQFQAYGSLWMPWERRGDFIRVIREARTAHDHHGSVLSAGTRADAEGFALALIDEVFRRRWISFRCVVTKLTADDALRRRTFSALIGKRLEALPLAGKEIRLRLTKLSRGAAEGGGSIEAALHQQIGEHVDPSVELDTRPARSGVALELVELLTGLVLGDWEKKNTSAHRRKLSDRAAENLGWGDLAGDTDPSEWKFNIWWLEDPLSAAAEPKAHRAVQLRLPMID